MAEKYIAKTDVTNHLQEIQKDKFINSDYKKFAWGMEIFIDTLPSADVEPVRRGHWICIGDIDEYIFECSECHEIYCLNDGTPKEQQYNYCPNCGTKLCKGEE